MLFVTQRAEAVTYFECSEWIAHGMWHVWRNCYRVLVGKPEGWDAIDWIYLAQDRDNWRAAVHTIMNLRVP
jgi:hypothetical protein